MTIEVPDRLAARLKEAASQKGVNESQVVAELIERHVPERHLRDQATIDLLDRIEREDRTDDPAEIARRVAEAEEFMRNLDRNRRESDGPNARRLWP